jgi:hypothetical protein
MSDTIDFQHVTPALRVHAGTRAFTQLPRELDRLGSKRAVIICGATLGREASPLDLVREALGGASRALSATSRPTARFQA